METFVKVTFASHYHRRKLKRGREKKENCNTPHRRTIPGISPCKSEPNHLARAYQFKETARVLLFRYLHRLFFSPLASKFFHVYSILPLSCFLSIPNIPCPYRLLQCLGCVQFCRRHHSRLLHLRR